LITRNGIVKLCDFGFARLLSEFFMLIIAALRIITAVCYCNSYVSVCFVEVIQNYIATHLVFLIVLEIVVLSWATPFKKA